MPHHNHDLSGPADELASHRHWKGSGAELARHLAVEHPTVRVSLVKDGVSGCDEAHALAHWNVIAVKRRKDQGTQLSIYDIGMHG